MREAARRHWTASLTVERRDDPSAPMIGFSELDKAHFGTASAIGGIAWAIGGTVGLPQVDSQYSLPNVEQIAA